MQGRCKGVASFKQALSRLMSKPRVWLEYGWSMARVWLQYIFVRKERTLCPSRTNSQSVEHGLRFLRNAAMLLLLMVVGIGGVKAQTVDYSGTYYIGSNSNSTGYTNTPANNYYLCPTEGWIYYKPTDNWETDGTTYPNPFLTTYKCRSNAYHSGDASNALWTIEKAPAPNSDYYYIKHNKDGKYWVSNGQISGTSNANRMRVHLEAVADENLDDKVLFEITPFSDNKSIVISPKSEDGWNYATVNGVKNTLYKWYTVNNGNKDYLVGNGSNGGPTNYTATGGILGLYTEDDINARFVFEDIVPRPVISYSSNNNQIEITHSEQNATFYYTTDGTKPTTTNYTGTGSEITKITSPVTIKAIAVISQEGCTLPIISPVAEIRVVPSANISFGSSPIVYSGSAQEPTVTVMDGNTEIPESEYTVSYSNNNINAGETVTVTITDNAGGNYIVYGSTTFNINPKPLTITANNKTITYGDTPANNGVTYSEFAGEETESVLTGTLTYSYNYEQYGDAGSYTITPSGLSNSNYDITFAPGTLTVNPKSLTVTANNHSITYGDTPAANGVIYGEFAGEETASVLSGSLDYDYSYEQYGDVGNAYTITPKGLSSTNYNISFVAGTLTVNKREVGIEWGNTSLGYNGSAQTPTATATNLVNNDEIAVTVTGAQTDVGTGYTATATGITGAKASNYVFPSSTITTTFSIGPGTFTPTVSIDGWTYGGTSNSPSVSGNTSGGDVAYSYTVKGEDNYSTDVPTNAGEYTVKVTIAAKGNYASVEATTDFTISPKSIGDGNMVAEGITIELTSTGDLSAVKDGDTILTEEDYTQETTEDGQDILVIVTGIGNYTGSAKGIYANPTFKDPDGEGAGKAAAVYKAKRDMAKPSGIKPYIVRKVNPTIGTLTISELEYIPEDVPVLLLSDAEADGFTASPKDENISEITDGTKNSNLLKVAPTGGVEVKAAQIYTFYQGEFVLTKAGTLSAGKFYLYNPNYTATSSAEQQGEGNAPSLSVLRFVVEESTGIIEMSNEKGDMTNGSAWYTLDGRKLNGKPTKAGLYIRNGRKTIIKRK